MTVIRWFALILILGRILTISTIDFKRCCFVDVVLVEKVTYLYLVSSLLKFNCTTSESVCKRKVYIGNGYREEVEG